MLNKFYLAVTRVKFILSWGFWSVLFLIQFVVWLCLCSAALFMRINFMCYKRAKTLMLFIKIIYITDCNYGLY